MRPSDCRVGARRPYGASLLGKEAPSLPREAGPGSEVANLALNAVMSNRP